MGVRSSESTGITAEVGTPVRDRWVGLHSTSPAKTRTESLLYTVFKGSCVNETQDTTITLQW